MPWQETESAEASVYLCVYTLSQPVSSQVQHWFEACFKKSDGWDPSPIGHSSSVWKGSQSRPGRAHFEQAVTVTGLIGRVLLSRGQILEQELFSVSSWLIWREIHTGTAYTLCINLSVCLSYKPHMAFLPAYLPLQDASSSLPSSSLPEGQEAWHGANFTRVSLGSASAVLHCSHGHFFTVHMASCGEKAGACCCSWAWPFSRRWSMRTALRVIFSLTTVFYLLLQNNTNIIYSRVFKPFSLTRGAFYVSASICLWFFFTDIRTAWHHPFILLSPLIFYFILNIYV